jgi:hypothetical protein
MLQAQSNPFGAKLTVHIRCFIYACHWHKQISYPTLSKAFNINTETVGKICRAKEGSRGYKTIHSIAEQMGVQQMYEKYATPELEDRVQTAVQNSAINTLAAPTQRWTGEGIYYLKNGGGVLVAVDIRHAKSINGGEFDRQDGFYVKHPQHGWNSHIGRPWLSGEEALRHLTTFPHELNTY